MVACLLKLGLYVSLHDGGMILFEMMSTYKMVSSRLTGWVHMSRYMMGSSI